MSSRDSRVKLAGIAAAVTATAAAGYYAYDQYNKRYPRYQEQLYTCAASIQDGLRTCHDGMACVVKYVELLASTVQHFGRGDPCLWRGLLGHLHAVVLMCMLRQRNAIAAARIFANGCVTAGALPRPVVLGDDW